MGTTRIKIIDLSSGEKTIKTARKHARLAPADKQAEKMATPKLIDEKPAAPPVSLENPTDQTNLAQPLTEEIKTSKEEPPTTSAITKKPKTKATKQSHHLGKKYQQAKNLVENKDYALTDALNLLPKISYTKFDPAVEIHLNVSDKNIKANVTMPYLKVEKRAKKYLIFTDKRLTINDEQIIWGDEKTITQIGGGQLKPNKDFDLVIASPKYMPTLVKIAKILGPLGLMPNPKNGTVTENVEKFLQSSASNNSLPIKSDPSAPIVHTKVGQLSQKTADLEANIKALAGAIGASKILSATLASTMGPGIKLDITTLR